MSHVIDFHGYTLEAAIEKTHQIIGEVRLKSIAKHNMQEQVTFITGTGIIKNELITILNSYDILFSIPSHNLGQIIVQIE